MLVLYRFYKAIESICVESIIEIMCCLTMNRVLTVIEHADFEVTYYYFLDFFTPPPHICAPPPYTLLGFSTALKISLTIRKYLFLK